MTNPCISHILALKRQKTGKEEAEKLLNKISNHVTQIMMKRKFKVGKLLEFFPTNPQLLGLNVNRGMIIKIRLRPAADESAFYPFNDLIGTMLHELAHNVHGPHDSRFYKLLDELWEDYEAGMDSRPLDEVSAHLGGRKVSESEAKRLQIEAAEKRAATSKLMTIGGRKLGGAGERPQDLRKAILDAAERRARDSKWCGAIIELDDCDEDAVQDVVVEKTNRRKISSSNAKGAATMNPQDIIILSSSDEEGADNHYTKKAKILEWTCKVCTLINAPSSIVCEVCVSPR